MFNADLEREYQAATQEAVWFNLATRSCVELTGKDRAAFLHNFCTNEVKQLASGRATEAFLTTNQAKVLAWLQVLALEDRLWLTGEPGLGEKIRSYLERYLVAEEVEIADRSAEIGQALLTGPRAEAIVGRLASAALPLAFNEHRAVDVPAGTVRLWRRDWLGAPGYFLLAPPEVLAAIQTDWAVPLGHETVYETLRMEAGVPAYGRDIDETNLPQEINRTEAAISFTKGCYIGQETVARIRAYGHVNRLLLTFKVELAENRRPEDSHVKLLAGGQEVGHLTSLVWSPRLEGWLALGYVRRGHQAVGTRFELSDGGSAKIIAWPAAAPACSPN